MKSPNINVQPLIGMWAGDRRFNKVSFNGVWVDRKNRIGEENKGWHYMTTALDIERATASGFFLGNCQRDLEEIIGYIEKNKLAQDPSVRYKIAQRVMEFEVLRMLSYRLLWLTEQGKIPTAYEASMVKLFGSELTQRIAQTGMEALGLYGQLEPNSPLTPLRGWLERSYLLTLGNTLAAGSSEIQRYIMATRGLGLPR